jgi:putative glycosyltransferase (TIGR04372 family)
LRKNNSMDTPKKKPSIASIFKNKIKNTIKTIIKAADLTISSPFALVIFFSQYRFVQPNLTRIGHLCGDLDVFLKKQVLGEIKHRAIVLAPPYRVANCHILEYFSKKEIYFIKNLFLCMLLKPLVRNNLSSINISDYSETLGSSEFHRIQGLWGKRPALFSLTEFDISRGKKALLEMGIPDDAWYVCIHSRESGYSGSYDFGQSFRNSDINTYGMAMDEIIKRGGWCIRMGDDSMKSIRSKKGVIDYAHYDKKSDWLDVYICATAKMFLGCSSGIYALSSIFGVPVATANMVPIGAVLPGGDLDLSIPKLFKDKKTGGHIKFKEIFESDISNARSDWDIISEKYEVISNSPEDIRNLLIEQLDRLDLNFIEDLEDHNRQKIFKSLLKPGHYSYGAASKISSLFLSKYSYLLVE